MTANRWRLRLIPAALALGATACVTACAAGNDAGDDPDAPSTTVTQSGDTTIIVPALDGPTGRLVSDLVLGADDSNPDAIFGGVSGAALAPDGRIYVIESQSQVVHVYTRSGAALDRLTFRGEGPGEIRSARDLVVRDDGYVLIREVGGDIEVFDSDGVHVDRWRIGWGSGPETRLSDENDLLAYAGASVTLNGRAWRVAGVEMEIYSAGTSPNLGDRPTGWFHRIAPGGERLDSAPSVVRGSDIPCLPTDVPTTYCIGLTFGPTPWMEIAPDGSIWSGNTASYRLDRSPGLGPPEGSVSSIRPERAPLPIPGDLRDALDGRFRELWSAVDAFEEIYPIPTQKPAIARVFPTRDGTIWVRLHAPSERTTDADGEEAWVETESRFDIFTPEGEHVGYVTGPVELSLRDIRGDTVLTARRGAYGVAYLERFLIDWSDPN